MRDYYVSGIGRYGQFDPIGLYGGFSPYAYVGNNPMWAVDPFGMQAGPLGGFPPTEAGEPYSPGDFRGTPPNFPQTINRNYSEAITLSQLLQETTELGHDLAEIQQLLDEYNRTHPHNELSYSELMGFIDGICPVPQSPLSTGRLLSTPIAITPGFSPPGGQQLRALP